MCTLVILRRPDHRWPVVIGANRDEMIGRAWRAPARHWPDRAEVIAGLDLLGGGSWLGLNDWGVVAAVLNRRGSLGPAPGTRSRGELVLEALDHGDAVAAAEALSQLDTHSYRTFNLILADNRDGFWLRHAGSPAVEVHPLKEGLSLIAAEDVDDLSTRRLELARPRFAALAAANPAADNWDGWQDLLSDAAAPPGEPETAAMRFRTGGGYGTVSSAVIALPQIGDMTRKPVFRFAGWLPEAMPWQDVPLTG
jgi:uncharacterized protein with NRDE domain